MILNPFIKNIENDNNCDSSNNLLNWIDESNSLLTFATSNFLCKDIMTSARCTCYIPLNVRYEW